MPALTRHFHVGDLLAVVTDDERASPRGVPGVQAVICHMTRYSAFALHDLDRCHKALRDAVLAAYPELGTYTAADVPPAELLPAWRRRVAREFGQYLVAPVLPRTHPLLTAPEAVLDGDPFPPRPMVHRAAEARADAGAESRADAIGAIPVSSPAGGPGEPPGARTDGPIGSRLRRRFHIGDLLAITTRRPEIARRGPPGAVALVSYMADRPLGVDDVRGRGEEFRAVLLTAYPELGTYTDADVPPPELLPVWMRRREREFGRYLLAPLLPASHPLRTIVTAGGRGARRA